MVYPLLDRQEGINGVDDVYIGAKKVPPVRMQGVKLTRVLHLIRAC